MLRATQTQDIMISFSCHLKPHVINQTCDSESEYVHKLYHQHHTCASSLRCIYCTGITHVQALSATVDIRSEFTFWRTKRLFTATSCTLSYTPWSHSGAQSDCSGHRMGLQAPTCRPQAPSEASVIHAWSSGVSKSVSYLPA